MTTYLETRHERKIAYHKIAAKGDGVNSPGIVFLGGFKSDMSGTKAVFLENWAKTQGRAFLRFDYSGHGQSSGAFRDGCIGDWADDAREVISALTEGPQVLVGSSMGGWMSLLMARHMPERIAGLVGIAAAPDFTEDGFWAGFTDAQKAELARDGQIALPSDYDEPYIITQKLIEDGRSHLMLRDPIHMPFPARFLHGTGDTVVDMSVPLRILERAEGDDIRVLFVQGSDHSFSEADDLQTIVTAINEVTTRAA